MEGSRQNLKARLQVAAQIKIKEAGGRWRSVSSRSHQGKSYATEAVTRLLEYLFTEHNLHCVHANCDRVNIASTKGFPEIKLFNFGSEDDR